MLIARHQQEAPQSHHQENPETCLSFLTCCENQALEQRATSCTTILCSTTAEDQSDAPASCIRPGRDVSAHAPAISSPSKPVCPKLLQAYLPLVHQIVRQIARRLPTHVLHDDLVAAGVVGLLDSLRRNGGDHGAAFEWYAKTRIRGAVVDELRAQDWLSRRTRIALTKAEQEQHTPPRVPTLVSLHELDANEESHHLASQDHDPEDLLSEHDEHRKLRDAIEELPDRERLIIGMHYFDGTKFKDIGIALGVSEPRVSQLLTRALGLLRAILAEESQRPGQAIPLRPDNASIAKVRALRLKRTAAARCVA